MRTFIRDIYALFTRGAASPNIDKETWVAPSADLIGSVTLSADGKVAGCSAADNEPITIGLDQIFRMAACYIPILAIQW